MDNELEILTARYRELGIDRQIDYGKFCLYSIITHSTAEGSTITELENQILFDQGISLRGKSIEEQNMNLDLKAAYERSAELAASHTPVTVDMLVELASLVMKNNEKYRKGIQNGTGGLFLRQGRTETAECHCRHRREILHELQQSARKTFGTL